MNRCEEGGGHEKNHFYHFYILCLVNDGVVNRLLSLPGQGRKCIHHG